jgi:hypothetical protein
MKVILSRKGFDSKYGGYPSPILPDGRMVSLPIPVNYGICYSSLTLGDSTYYELMRQLKPRIRCDGQWEELTEGTECHLDPDICRDILPRQSGWRACFGQVDAAQSHLENKGVGVGDLFLFFGWFRRTEKAREGLRFTGPDLHVIFGYLQIGQIEPCDEEYCAPEWMYRYPHLLAKRRRKSNNTIYVARNHAAWNSNLPGAGAFNFDPCLMLTKQGQSRSKWQLAECFRSACISHHNKASWKDGYFQSAPIGQEFVIQDNREVEEWAKALVGKGIQRKIRNLAWQNNRI